MKNVLVLLSIETMNYRIRETRNIPNWLSKTGFNHWEWIIVFLFFLLLPISVNAQTTSYGQLANEAQFARAISDKWAA
jgi:CHASE1-domain containing sensor protein